MLTRKQHTLLIFIADHLNQTGISPSFEEMKEGLRLKSKSSIYRLITALEERGFLARRHNRARALELLRMPGNLVDGNLSTDAPRTEDAGFGRQTLPIGFSETVADTHRASCNGAIGAIQVPLHVRMTAGLGAEAPHVLGDHLVVPTALLPDGIHVHYALEVVTDSMIDADIPAGDMVIVRRDETVENWTVAGTSRDGDAISLESINLGSPKQVVRSKRATGQGRLVALLWRYSESEPG